MNDYEWYRDAIHVPFIVLRCQEIYLMPGQKCSLRTNHSGGDNYRGDRPNYVQWVPGDEIPWHGVVDPFLESPVAPGVLFRLYIRKECFSGLTHHFTINTNDSGGTDTCHSVCDIH